MTLPQAITWTLLILIWTIAVMMVIIVTALWVKDGVPRTLRDFIGCVAGHAALIASVGMGIVLSLVVV